LHNPQIEAEPKRHTITASDSVTTRSNSWRKKQIGALVVTDRDSVAGIITERDYARKVVLKDARRRPAGTRHHEQSGAFRAARSVKR